MRHLEANLSLFKGYRCQLGRIVEEWSNLKFHVKSAMVCFKKLSIIILFVSYNYTYKITHDPQNSTFDQDFVNRSASYSEQHSHSASGVCSPAFLVIESDFDCRVRKDSDQLPKSVLLPTACTETGA